MVGEPGGGDLVVAVAVAVAATAAKAVKLA
jgi:hypothetical protein